MRSQIVVHRVVLAAALVAIAVGSGSAQTVVQQHDDHAAPAAFTGPIDLYKVGLGPFTRKISSSSPEAQAFFNQGFQLTYALAKPEAVRSFRQAGLADPACAICFWGEAWAWGSDLNWTMGADEAPQAYAAIQKALALVHARTPAVERALIQAMSARYVARFDPATQVVRDRAFADAMKTVADTYPDDPDVATIYAEALFLLEPRSVARDIASPNVQRIAVALERVLKADLRHPGACHLYIHIMEATTEPHRATACAEFLGTSIPGASHINHMPSHIWTRVGRWGDAVKASLDAWHSDLKSQIGEGIAIYPWHDLHMLIYSASMDGQAALAIQASRDYQRMLKDPMYLLLTLVRFGKFEEISDLSVRPDGVIAAPVWDFAQGYAHLGQGQRDPAIASMARLRYAADNSTAVFRAHPAKSLLGVLAGILEGELALAARNGPAALAAFEKAVTLQDGLPWDEPEPLPFSARHWLGAALVDTGRPADAEAVYRADLEKYPKNGWALMGLGRALAAQGKPSREVEEEFARAWTRSDTWIRASRF